MSKVAVTVKAAALSEFFGMFATVHIADETVLQTMREYGDIDRSAGVYSPAVNEGYRLIDMIDAIHRSTGVKKTDSPEDSVKAFDALFSNQAKFSSLQDSVRSLSLEVAAYRRIYGDLPA